MKKMAIFVVLLACLLPFHAWATMSTTTHGLPKPLFNDSGASKAAEFNAAMDAFDAAVWAALGDKAAKTAHFITNQAESGLDNEINLGALSSGILKITVADGVATVSVAGAGDIAWSLLSGTPTTLAGYGITDALGLHDKADTAGAADTAANLSGTPTVPNGTTATTQSQGDNSTKLATTAYVDTGLGTKQPLPSTVLYVSQQAGADNEAKLNTAYSAAVALAPAPVLIVCSQTIEFTADRDYSASNVYWRFLPGTYLDYASGHDPVSRLAGTATNTDTAGTGTISSTHNTYVVTGSGTSWHFQNESAEIYGYEYITPTSAGDLQGVRRKIKRHQNDITLEIMNPFTTGATDLSGSDFSISNPSVSITGHGLYQGDAVYFNACDSGAERYYIGKVVDENTITLNLHPSSQFPSGSESTWARDYRIKFGNVVDAGFFQWIAEDGPNVRFLVCQQVKPEWWGASSYNADAAGYKENRKALTRGSWSGGFDTNRAGVELLISDYYITDGSVVLRPVTTTKGVNRGWSPFYDKSSSTIKCNGNAHAIVNGYFYTQTAAPSIILKDFMIGGSSYVVDGIHGTFDNSPYWDINNVSIDYVHGWAIWTEFALISKCHITAANGVLAFTDTQLLASEVFLAWKEDTHLNNYCVLIAGSNNLIQNNFLMGVHEGSHVETGVYFSNFPGAANQVTLNRINNMVYGCVGGIGLFSGNTFYNVTGAGIKVFLQEDWYTGTATNLNYNLHAHTNYFYMYGSNKPAFEATNDNTGGNGSFVNNDLTYVDDGYRFNIDYTKLVSCAWRIENNTGYDINGYPLIANGDTSPSLLTAKIWRTSNSGSTNISNFELDVAMGTERLIMIGDNNTTLVLSGSYMEGTGESTISCRSGDIVKAIYNGSKWKVTRLGGYPGIQSDASGTVSAWFSSEVQYYVATGEVTWNVGYGDVTYYNLTALGRKPVIKTFIKGSASAVYISPGTYGYIAGGAAAKKYQNTTSEVGVSCTIMLYATAASDPQNKWVVLSQSGTWASEP